MVQVVFRRCPHCSERELEAIEANQNEGTCTAWLAGICLAPSKTIDKFMITTLQNFIEPTNFGQGSMLAPVRHLTPWSFRPSSGSQLAHRFHHWHHRHRRRSPAKEMCVRLSSYAGRTGEMVLGRLVVFLWVT